MKYVFVGWWLRLLFRPWVQGIENIPDDGPAILASNHLSFSDSIFLPLMVDRHITFLAKSDYFTGKGIKGRLIAWFMSRRRPGARSTAPVGGRARRRIAHRAAGPRRGQAARASTPRAPGRPDGRLYRGKTGVARMALEAQVPIIPVAMINTREIQPPGKIIPAHRSGRHPDRDAARLLPLRGHGGRPVRPALGHRRAHVRADGALRPGVRRRLRLACARHRVRQPRRRRTPTTARPSLPPDRIDLAFDIPRSFIAM